MGTPTATSSTWDEDHALTLQSRPDGENVTPTYEASTGRLQQIVTPRETLSLAYESTAGRLQSISGRGVTLTYGYLGPLQKQVQWSGAISGTLTRTFDNDFRVASETVQGGATVSYGYDADSLLTTAGALTLQRDASTGFLTGATLGNVTESRTYNAYGEEASYTSSFVSNGTTTPLYSVTYDTPTAPRDGLGRIKTKTETVLGETHVYTYAYDAAGRLADVTKDGTPTAHYEYDANGNRLVGPGLTSTPVYDAQDRLLEYGRFTYTYKPSGELRTKRDWLDPQNPQVTTYDYDAFGNLRNVKLPDGTHLEYVIDGQNRRVGKKACATAIDVPCPAGSLVEGFLYRNQLQPVAWLNPDGSIKAQFVYGTRPNVPEYMIKDGQTYRFVLDQVGSVRMVVNAANGEVAERIEYDAFGNVLGGSEPGGQPYGWAGGLGDRDSGLVRFGARDYSPTQGRWGSKDPIRFSGGVELYAYVDSDPINRSDPTGLFAIGPCTKSLLSRKFGFLPEDLDAADVMTRPTWDFPKHKEGIIMAQTSGVDISFREGYANFSAGEALDGRTLAILAHEMVHVTQYRRNRELAPWYVPGWLADQQLRARHQSGALEREKPWEIPAYRISDRAEKDFGSGPLDPCNCSL